MKTKEQKQNQKMSLNVAHLRRQNYKIDITHQFKGGVDQQALTVDHIMELPNRQTIKEVSGICQVVVTTPEGQVATGTAITSEPYCKKRGVQIALGRAMKNLKFPNQEPVFKPLVKVFAIEDKYEFQEE